LAKAVHRHTCSLTASALDASSRAMLDEVYARDFAELGYSSRFEEADELLHAGVQLRGREPWRREPWRFVDWGASVMGTEWDWKVGVS
jgi:hypothetical protein